jgi:hypothetical protein
VFTVQVSLFYNDCNRFQHVFKGTVQQDFTGVKTRFKRSVLINYTYKCCFLLLPPPPPFRLLVSCRFYVFLFLVPMLAGKALDVIRWQLESQFHKGKTRYQPVFAQGNSHTNYHPVLITSIANWERQVVETTSCPILTLKGFQCNKMVIFRGAATQRQITQRNCHKSLVIKRLWHIM